MKRVISALCILALCIFLAACGAGTPPPAPTEFSAKAQVLFGESQFAALVTQERPGALEVEFTAPETLRGMRFSLRGNHITVHDGELQTQLPAAALPVSNFAVLLSGVLLRLAQPSPEGFTRIRGGGWTLSGTANSLQFQAVISSEGLLERVEVPAAGLEIYLGPVDTKQASHETTHIL